MCTEAVPPHGVVKLTIAGNLGQGSQAATINKLSNGCELPCEWWRALANAFVERNAAALTALQKAWADAARRDLQRDIQQAFEGGVVPEGQSCPEGWRNVRDVIYGDWRRTFLVGAQGHVQKKLPVQVRMPRHFDGGRGLLCFCCRVYGDPTLRVWRGDGTFEDIPSFPGSVYLTSLLASEHQVIHAAREPGSDVYDSRALDAEVEVTFFCRSATLGHKSCSQAGFLWNDDLDGRLCAALNAAFAGWAESHTLELPTGPELRVARDEARRAAAEADRPARKKARVH